LTVRLRWLGRRCWCWCWCCACFCRLLLLSDPEYDDDDACEEGEEDDQVSLVGAR
jgi:hypothetical protein